MQCVVCDTQLILVIMQLTGRVVILHLFTLNTVMATCTLEDQRRVQARFSNCTSEYKAEYSRVVGSNKEEVEKLTCQLVEDIVEVCGDEWRECHDEEDVRRMKDMHVESLLNKNRRARVDIELCQVVRLFRYTLLITNSNKHSTHCLSYGKLPLYLLLSVQLMQVFGIPINDGLL